MEELKVRIASSKADITRLQEQEVLNITDKNTL
jgi:hypothetical protein